MNGQIAKSLDEGEKLKTSLDKMFDDVAAMVKLFKQTKYVTSVASEMDYDEGSSFNETNILQYLGELEEYISLLLNYVAHKRTDQYAAITSLNLEKLGKITDKDLKPSF